MKSLKNLAVESYRKNAILKYLLVALIILLSVLTWYNFYGPPIDSNTGFFINLSRYVRYYYLPFNFYSWPVSYNPMVNYFPIDLIYSVLNLITYNSYSVSFFIYNVGLEIMGALSLFYLTSQFLKKYGIPETYAFLSIIIYAFNISVFLDGSFETGTSQLLVVLLLLYLSIYRSRRFIFLLGFLSFFIFFPFPGGYPAGALILIEEFLIICALIILKEIKNSKRSKSLSSISISILLSIGAVGISLSYLLSIIYASGSTLIANSVSLKPDYVFGFLYDWIAVLPNAMRLILNWGVYTVYAGPWVVPYLTNPVISVLLYILPFFSIASIIFLKRGDYYLYILMVISIFAATTANPPFGKLFEYLILYVGPLRPFYESDAYYPILVIFYSLLFPVTLYNFSEIIKELIKHHVNYTRKMKTLLLNKKTHKVFAVTIVVLVLATAFPLYTGLVDESGSAMPVESTIPNYYIQANNFISSQGKNNPVMVLPGIYGFSSYETNDRVWYQGIDLYPALISNPSISNDISGSYTIGRGDAYSAISYVYGEPLSTITESTQNDNSLVSSGNFITSNTTLVRWVANYPSDNVSFINALASRGLDSTILQYRVNSAIYNSSIGSHDLLGYFGHSLDLINYNFVILNFTAPIPTSTISIGFMNTSGDFFYYVTANNFIPTITPEKFSTIPIYLGTSNQLFEKQKVEAIAISYNYQTGNPHKFNMLLSSFKFSNSSIGYANIISRNLNILGVKYAYVDTGIVDGYGQFNGYGYNSILENSSLFSLTFKKGTISIYLNRAYDGLISDYSRVSNYRNESSLLGNLYFNISSSAMPLYGLNSGNFNSSSDSNITGYQMISPTDYIVNVSYQGPFALFFKEGYNPNWIATNSDGKVINTHFEADGYGNAWIINSKTSIVHIIYKGATIYADLVTFTIVVPFLMMSVFVFLYFQNRKKNQGR